MPKRDQVITTEVSDIDYFCNSEVHFEITKLIMAVLLFNFYLKLKHFYTE